MGVEALSGAISELFADAVSVAVVAIADKNATATEAELAALGKAVDKRRLEFSAGRHAARLALSGLSLPPRDILIGPHRQPLPPANSVLSISHDVQHAMAVAASAQDWFGIGIDIGDADTLSPDLIHSICRGNDLLNLAVGESLGQRAKLVFCLKEALFKAISPQVNSWMEFSQSELRIDHAQGSFEADIFASDGTLLKLQGQWFGRFARVDKRWLAVAGMRRP